MKSIDLELELPESLNIKNLRKFIINNISSYGELIRWSIYEIIYSEDNSKRKIIKINALILN